MTNDGARAYTWDEENRLIQVRDMQTDEILVQNKYDGQSRRREKIENGVTNRYVYDGWLVVAVLDGQNNVLEQYAHGPDLGGERETAGGIGGILSVTTATSTNFYHYDGNGNVVATTDERGDIVSRLEYDPFGRILLTDGNNLPRFQFSSKEYDETTGLNYYGYRFYSPEMGRWPNRDPIEETAFSEFVSWAYIKAVLKGYNVAYRYQLKLYAFVVNNPISQIDILGLTKPGDYCTESELGDKKTLYWSPECIVEYKFYCWPIWGRKNCEQEYHCAKTIIGPGGKQHWKPVNLWEKPKCTACKK